METKQRSFKKDANLEWKFERAIKSILGLYFITKDIQKDLEAGTDFAIYKITPFKVGVRLRRFNCYKYRHQFTIRYSRPSGHITEYGKIMAGDVDYILYGFINPDESKIIQYFIGDLRAFREVNPKPVQIKPNNPPDSDFAIYNISQFPKEFVLHSYCEKAVG